jgi:hypothetical protein
VLVLPELLVVVTEELVVLPELVVLAGLAPAVPADCR